MRVEVRREAAADLIPRFDGSVLRLTSRRALAEPGRGGLLLGPVLLDLAPDGRLEGATVLEERRMWQRSPIAWELPARATPHRLGVLEDPGAPPAQVHVRWDPARLLCALVVDEVPAPRVVALGPRAYAALDGDRLAGLLADLRGFDRARG